MEPSLGRLELYASLTRFQSAPAQGRKCNEVNPHATDVGRAEIFLLKVVPRQLPTFSIDTAYNTRYQMHSYLLLLLLLLTKRLTWHLVQKLQGHVTHTKKTTCSVDKETRGSAPSVRGHKQICLQMSFESRQ